MTPVIRDEVEIPKKIMEANQQIELCIDIMYVNKIAFLTTIDRQIKYRAVVPLNNRTKEELYEGVDQITRLYNGAGFEISTIYMDGEFKSVMDQVKDDLGISMNYTNAQDHEPTTERNNRTLKERIRVQYHHLLYKNICKLMIRYLAMETARKLNYFPVKGGVSTYYSPRMIMHQERLEFKKHCAVPFGAFVQASHETEPTNTQAERTIDAIYL